MLLPEMGQTHKHMDTHSVLKTQEKRGCYIKKIPLTLFWEIVIGIPDVVESESFKVLEVNSDLHTQHTTTHATTTMG